MSIIVHDPCPDRTDHLALEIRYQTIIAFSGSEIIRVHPQFRLFDDTVHIGFRGIDLFRHRYLTFL